MPPEDHQSGGTDDVFEEFLRPASKSPEGDLPVDANIEDSSGPTEDVNIEIEIYHGSEEGGDEGENDCAINPAEIELHGEASTSAEWASRGYLDGDLEEWHV